MICKLCFSNQTDLIYKPVNSKIESTIFICSNCGFVFAVPDSSLYEISNKEVKNKGFTKLSCDADYSEIRVGKQQMVKYFFENTKEIVFKFPIKKVLDLRSARGHFVLMAINHFSLNKIYCIEEDEYMTTSYANNDKVELHLKKYYDFNPDYCYDLIYSCHSLEHYLNPWKLLSYVRSKLKSNGYFYIDVPNLAAIDNIENIDEFFYDKHVLYFNENLLVDFIESIGFKKVISCSNGKNIGVLFEKSQIYKKFPQSNFYDINSHLINNYKFNLNYNRNKLLNTSKEIIKLFEADKKNLIYGCGRVLDYLISYCNLNINNFQYLVDNYLSEVVDELYGKKLYNESILNKVNIDFVLLLVKNPNEELVNSLKQINKKIKIITISDLL